MTGWSMAMVVDNEGWGRGEWRSVTVSVVKVSDLFLERDDHFSLCLTGTP